MDKEKEFHRMANIITQTTWIDQAAGLIRQGACRDFGKGCRGRPMPIGRSFIGLICGCFKSKNWNILFSPFSGIYERKYTLPRKIPFYYALLCL